MARDCTRSLLVCRTGRAHAEHNNNNNMQPSCYPLRTDLGRMRTTRTMQQQIDDPNSLVSCRPNCVVAMIHSLCGRYPARAYNEYRHLLSPNGHGRLRRLSELAKASVHNADEPRQLRSTPLIGDSFDDFEAQMFSLLLWFHNGGLLQLTATVDYDANRDSIKEILAARLRCTPPELRIGEVCSATRKVLFNLGLLYIDSGTRGAWPEDVDQDLCLHAVQLPMCPQAKALVPVVRVEGSYAPYHL